MSKAVRIREHLYDEIARLAKEERRSILAQLEVLLEQALRLRSSEAGHGVQGDPATVTSTGVITKQPASDSHFRPDPK